MRSLPLGRYALHRAVVYRDWLKRGYSLTSLNLNSGADAERLFVFPVP
jgi:hypothetical protein